MSKQTQGSKKKARLLSYLARQERLKQQKLLNFKINHSFKHGTMEETANLLGIKLK